MTYYLTAQVAIHDRERHAKYEAGFMPALNRYGGRLLAVSDAPDVLEGGWDGQRLVVVAFDDRAAAMTWWNSPEYGAIVGHRRAASDVVVVGAEGLQPPSPR